MASAATSAAAAAVTAAAAAAATVPVMEAIDGLSYCCNVGVLDMICLYSLSGNCV